MKMIMNNRTTLSAYSTLLLFAALALPAGNAAAQDAKSVAGTYTAVSAPFGDNPRGQLILGRDGHYSLILARTTLPKVASGNRLQGTADENKAIVQGSNAHFGKYTVNAKDKTITFNVEASTFPNWDGTTIKRAFKVSGDQLTYTNNAPTGGGGAVDVVWKRVK
jgi:Lipocalin-like domain